VPPAQLPPAAPPAIRQAPRPLLLGPGGSSSPPLLATAGPVPPPTARSRAPDTADRRGCRTAVRSCGRPGSANRRSAGCTDRNRRAWASRYRCGPWRSPSRVGWRSPRAGGSSGRSRDVTALGLVPGSDQPTRADGHGHVGAASRFHRTRAHDSGRTGSGRLSMTPQEVMPVMRCRPVDACRTGSKGTWDEHSRWLLLVVGLGGLEPPASSLSGIFAGCVQAA
jgi:hypothetical protein